MCAVAYSSSSIYYLLYCPWHLPWSSCLLTPQGHAPFCDCDCRSAFHCNTQYYFGIVMAMAVVGSCSSCSIIINNITSSFIKTIAIQRSFLSFHLCVLSLSASATRPSPLFIVCMYVLRGAFVTHKEWRVNVWKKFLKLFGVQMHTNFTSWKWGPYL